MAALVFLASLAIGTNDAMIRNSTGLFSGHISGIDIPASIDTDPLMVSGVEHVLVRRQQRCLLWTNDIFEPILLMAVNPLLEKQATVLWKKTVSGRYLLPDDDGIYLNQETAERLHVTVGGQVHLGTTPGKRLKTLTVVGIYKTGLSSLDQGLGFCPVEAFPFPDNFTTLAIFLQDSGPAERILQNCQERVPTGTFFSWSEFMPDLKQLIDLNFVCMAMVMILVFALVAVGISCAFLIFILKNLREHGIMKTMGIAPGDTALLLVCQVGLLIFSAATVGLLAGVAVVILFARTGIDLTNLTSHNQYFAVSGMIYPRLTTLSLLTPPILALVFGLAAALWPALYIMSKRPADILRSV
ncbi:MAG: FtsX-like permease family protein [Desulfofustis sp.]|nr:FtsX-like permease family protein [Desulfofustis sp.]